jgi:large subunit ribosomal protein L30
MSSENTGGTVRVKLVRSPNSTPERHRLCVKALGLKRLHQVVELKDSPSVRGLINKVHYLVRVES